MLTALIGLALFAAALVWLHRAKARDVDLCAAELGLRRVEGKVESRGRTPEGLAFHELLWLRGTLDGLPADVAERRVRLPIHDRYRRQRSSLFTVLSVSRPRASTRTFRLQPVGLMGGIENLMHEPPPAVPTGDAAFDAAYRLYAEDAGAAVLALTPELRQGILAVRASVAGPLPPSAASYFAAGLLLGTFEIGADRASYSVYGTPSRKIALHLKAVGPLLARLAAA